jgi:hypothetical protein
MTLPVDDARGDIKSLLLPDSRWGHIVALQRRTWDSLRSQGAAEGTADHDLLPRANGLLDDDLVAGGRPSWPRARTAVHADQR